MVVQRTPPDIHRGADGHRHQDTQALRKEDLTHFHLEPNSSLWESQAPCAELSGSRGKALAAPLQRRLCVLLLLSCACVRVSMLRGKQHLLLPTLCRQKQQPMIGMGLGKEGKEGDSREARSVLYMSHDKPPG